MEYFVNLFGPWILTIVVLGSLVDVFQFLWILKRVMRRIKQKIYHRVRKQIMEEMKNVHR